MNNPTLNSGISQPVIIRAALFQPFESRRGVDEVIKLEFTFDAALVARLKALFEVYRPRSPYRTVGGWLPEHKAWFVEPTAWPDIRDELLILGSRIEWGQP